MTYDSSYDYWANKTCTTDLICLTTRFWLLMIANVNGWSWHYSVSLWLWIVLLLHCTHPVLYEEPCVHMFTNSIIQSATGHSHTNIGQELHLKFTSHIRISVTLTMAWLWAPEMLVSIFLKRMVSWDFYPQKGLHRMMQKKNHTKTSIEPQFCRQKLLSERSEETGLTCWSWQNKRKATLNNCGEQKNISELTTCRTLKRMSAKNVQAAEGTGLTKLDSWRLEKCSLV